MNATASALAHRPPMGIKWDIVAGIVVIHAGALLAPFTFTWKG